MSKANNLLGMKFGRLTVLSRTNSDKKGNAQWVCQCDCGKKKTIRGDNLTGGISKSCGCVATERLVALTKTHGRGDKNERMYKIWLGIRQRCLNRNNAAYKHYGGRGISICKEWLEDFMNFYNWAIANGYEKKLSLDRIDNNGNYCPENCRWATHKEQTRNTRRNRLLTYNNETHCIREWEEITGLNKGIIWKRIFLRGWDVERALTIPNTRHQGVA